VQRVGDFHEWWSRDNQPRGSGQFRGSAGVLGRAIEMLQAWAEQHKGTDQSRTNSTNSPTRAGHFPLRGTPR
jgi:hypothetical protein